jgi:hypothetical protein
VESAEKKGWLTHYRGIALVAEGILTLEKRAQAVRSVVPHLGVSGGAKKKTKPAKAPKNGTATP